MLDQSYNLDLFFGCTVILDFYLFQETVLLNPCFMFSTNLMLSFIDKATLVLFIWNIVLFALPAGLAGSSGVLDISEITKSFEHNKSSSISSLIKGKQKVSKIYSNVSVE